MTSLMAIMLKQENGRVNKMNRSEKISIIAAIAVVLAFMIFLVVGACNISSWEKGYTAKEWLLSYTEELKIDYDEIELVKKIREQEYIGYVYKIYTYEEISSDSISDVDIWHSKRKELIVYEWFEDSNYFWNKVAYSMFYESTWKYEKCLDFDVTILE